MLPFVYCQSYRLVWVNLDPIKEPTESLESTLRTTVVEEASATTLNPSPFDAIGWYNNVALEHCIFQVNFRGTACVFC